MEAWFCSLLSSPASQGTRKIRAEKASGIIQSNFSQMTQQDGGPERPRYIPHLCRVGEGGLWYPGHLAVPALAKFLGLFCFLIILVRVLQEAEPIGWILWRLDKPQICRADVPV